MCSLLIRRQQGIRFVGHSYCFFRFTDCARCLFSQLLDIDHFAAPMPGVLGELRFWSMKSIDNRYIVVVEFLVHCSRGYQPTYITCKGM